jgi:heme exporter protein CcmD
MSATGLFDLSGHGYFIWASYGMLALAVAVELYLLRQRRQRALQEASVTAGEAPARKALVREGQAQ